ncbi:hypothetical protein [Ascidiimonas sp. W6]|uniref:hypothetical protein n=1 Tax=Ascidiimonas meishanensis TaxID=3128903 RepID=UPI0030EF9C6B
MKTLFSHTKENASAIQSGLGTGARIYGAMFNGILALFGGTPTLINLPTAPMTVVSAAFITAIIASKKEILNEASPF